MPKACARSHHHPDAMGDSGTPAPKRRPGRRPRARRARDAIKGRLVKGPTKPDDTAAPPPSQQPTTRLVRTRRRTRKRQQGAARQPDARRWERQGDNCLGARKQGQRGLYSAQAVSCNVEGAPCGARGHFGKGGRPCTVQGGSLQLHAGMQVQARSACYEARGCVPRSRKPLCPAAARQTTCMSAPDDTAVHPWR